MTAFQHTVGYPLPRTGSANCIPKPIKSPKLRKNSQELGHKSDYDYAMDTWLKRDRLRSFVDLIVGSLGEDVDGKAIAARGFLSRYHFDRLVTTALHETPGAFRRRLLLERAAWTLSATDDTILRIAVASGFRSQEGFTRAFSRAFGTTPARYRVRPGSIKLGAPNGIHFHPPGGLYIPGPKSRSNRMDVIDRLVGHDAAYTHRLLDKAGTLPGEALDRTVLNENELLFGSGELTLRVLLDDMVANKERWVAAITGKPAPADQCQSIQGMKKRLDIAGSEFQRLIKVVRDKNNWDAGFVDALCDPPESFTYGGMLAHVVNFSVYRRNLAILAFRELGVDDLGIGDPIEWERNIA